MRPAVLALAALVLAGSEASACEAARHLKFNVPVTLEGVVGAGTGRHEAEGPYSYTYLELPEGICVDGEDNDPDDAIDESGTKTPVDRIQLGGKANSGTLTPGARVRAHGTLFPAHTQWHAEAVLLDASRIEELQ